MALRFPEETPKERHLRRLRLFWWGSGFSVLCLILLVVAFVGGRAARRLPEMAFQPADSVVGELVLSREYLLGVLPGSLAQADPETARALTDGGEALRKVIGAELRVHFLAAAGDGVRWVAFLPVVRPQRLHAERLRRLIERAGGFQQFGSIGTTAPALGYVGFVPEGVFFSSEFERPEGKLVPAKPKRAAPLAGYESDSGYLPPLYSQTLARADFSSTEGQPIMLHWHLRPERRINLSGTDRDFTWFDPLLPGLEVPAEPVP